jgi:N-formylglutamate amidohydrolase
MPKISYTIRKLVSTNIGNLPILITCPHNGNGCPEDVPDREKSNYSDRCERQGRFTKKPDKLTMDITDGVAENIHQLTKKEPYVVKAEFERRCIDANRSRKCAYDVPQAKKFYNEYHGEIRSCIKKINQSTKGLGFLFDIHGTVGISQYDADIIFGTNNGVSISDLLELNPDALWDNNGLIALLQNKEYKTAPRKKSDCEIQELNGGFTVTHYGSTKGIKGLQAIQIEIAPKFRGKDISIRKLFESHLAKSIVTFVREYYITEYAE